MTKLRHLFAAQNVVCAAIFLAACMDDPNSLLGGRKNTSVPGDDELPAEALQCTNKPEGRSYSLFDGTKLEGTRENENIGINRARFKPFAVMAGEYRRVLGVVPKSLDGAGASFDPPPARWYSEPHHSGVSLNAMFEVSFEACSDHVASGAEYAKYPTEQTAEEFCRTMMRRAWSRAPSREEIGECVELATKKLSEESNTRRRWSYVCASILSSSPFLTF